MIRKTVTKRNLQEPDGKREELAYWLRRPPEERVSAVDDLRNQYYGSAARIQRVARVVQRSRR